MSDGYTVDTVDEAILIVDAVRDCVKRLSQLSNVEQRCKAVKTLNDLFNGDSDGEDNSSE
jgi:hypothetical protein